MIAKSVKENGHEYTTAFAYAPGAAAGKTTGLISGITQTGENFSYTYDDVGNIASVTHNGKVTAYSYDPLGQLIRVNDQDDPTSGATGTTWTYEYDQGGNILSKKRYTYTEAADFSGATLLETDTFSYTDTNWRDKLTGYNGSSITYDEIGNPLNDGTWTYTWINGRQLAEMSKQDGSLTASFVYNADGLRVRKTVNGVVTKYILHGKNITHLIRGNDELHFFYDASGSPAMVEWNNGTTVTKYAYVKNLQGDIIAIIDDTGAEAVKYTYDAWGTPVSTSGTMVGTLGLLQPFRYRGYVYDDETGLYYLRSRYYSVVWERFLNPDIFVKNQSSAFHYCIPNPINMFDGDGCEERVCGDPIAIYYTSPYYFLTKSTPLYKDGQLSEFIQVEYGTYPGQPVLIYDIVENESGDIISYFGILEFYHEGKLQSSELGFISADALSPTLYNAIFPVGHVFEHVGVQYNGVDTMQNYLKQIGYDIIVTKKYDQRTMDTVKQFQSDVGIVVDGKAGDNTFRWIAWQWIRQFLMDNGISVSQIDPRNNPNN